MRSRTTVTIRRREDGSVIGTFPASSKVSLLSVPGFILHRPLNGEGTGLLEHGWLVSHIETGLNTVEHPEWTQKLAINYAEISLRRAGATYSVIVGHSMSATETVELTVVETMRRWAKAGVRDE